MYNIPSVVVRQIGSHVVLILDTRARMQQWGVTNVKFLPKADILSMLGYRFRDDYLVAAERDQSDDGCEGLGNNDELTKV
jgi:hypothetical protein